MCKYKKQLKVLNTAKSFSYKSKVIELVVLPPVSPNPEPYLIT